MYWWYEWSEILGTSRGKYYENKRKLSGKIIIGNTCFTYVVLLGGILFSNSPNNHNHVRKDKNYLLSVIITLGTNVIGGDIFFHDEVRIYNLGLWELMFWIIYMEDV